MLQMKMRLLVLLVFLLIVCSCDSHSHSHEDEPPHHKYSKEANQPAVSDDDNSFDGPLAFLNDTHIRLWVYSIGSTLLISALPFFILAFIPIKTDTSENSSLLKILLAFGAGGLLGDAFLHLIPHATPQSSSHSHSHAHAHEPHDMSVGGWVLTGFMIFFIVEKFVRIMRGEDGHSHSHSHAAIKENTPNAPPQHQQQQKIRVAAYLNLVADIMHNFTDGLAIGASFIAGSTVGLVTMITVLVHEIPHEIGDFAILIQAGCSKKKAMFTQLLTAIGSLCGCVVSLWSVDAYALAEAAEQSWVLPFTAGGFIYIATVSVIPELLEGATTLMQSVVEVAAILFGVFMMYLIAIYE